MESKEFFNRGVIYKNIFSGLFAGIVYSSAYTSLMAVILSGFNSKVFSPFDLFKILLALLLWFLSIGAVLGIFAGAGALMAGVIAPLHKFSHLLPWVGFSGIYLLQLIIIFVHNSYLFDAFTNPAIIWVPIFLVLVIAGGLIALFMRWLRPVGRLPPVTSLVLIFLMLIVMPLSLARKESEDKDKSSVLATPQDSPYNLEQATGYKVMLIGIDGMDWKIAVPLLAEGKMPNLQSLIEQGARDYLATLTPTSSPLIWTTLSTGKSPGEHGINSFIAGNIPYTGVDGGNLLIPNRTGLTKIKEFTVFRLLNAQKLSINSTLRQEKALWNILTEQGMSSNIINWWATWPAEKILGNIVSDTAIYFIEQSRGEEIVNPLDNLTYPLDLTPKIIPLISSSDKVSYETILKYVDISREEFSEWEESKFKLGMVLPFAISSDESIRRISIYILKNYPDFSLFAAYTRAVDIMSHTAMIYSIRVNNPGVSKEEQKKFGRCLDEIYKDADRFLGDIMNNAPTNTIFIVVSDHGFEKHPRKNEYVHFYAPPGIVVIAGGPIVHSANLENPTVYDITPTVLYLLGLPVAQDMRGRVWSEIIDPEFLKNNPIRTIETYGPYIPPEELLDVKSDKKVDEEIKRQLRALGYIK